MQQSIPSTAFSTHPNARVLYGRPLACQFPVMYSGQVPLAQVCPNRANLKNDAVPRKKMV
jgi:hypothetical protein